MISHSLKPSINKVAVVSLLLASLASASIQFANPEEKMSFKGKTEFETLLSEQAAAAAHHQNIHLQAIPQCANTYAYP